MPVKHYPIFPPSRCELVLNKVKEDKITHYSSIPVFQHSNWGEAPKFKYNSALNLKKIT